MVPLSYIFRSLGRRKLRTVMTIAGVAFVVALYASMSAVADTMVRSFKTTGAPDEVVIVQAGAMVVDFSHIDRSTLSFVQTLDGVAVGPGEIPAVSAELCVGTVAEVSAAERDISVRGVTAHGPGVYSQVRLVEGSWPRSGGHVTLGRVAATKLDMEIGDSLELEGRSWTVAGILEAGGRVYDQEVWVDLDDLAAAAHRTTYSSYTVRAENRAEAAAIVESIAESRRYPLRAQLASDFYARSGGMSIWMAQLGKLIALVIALGAAILGMNTMYSAVASRRRELGMLRALGFGRGAVLLSFVLESLLQCVIGGVLGIGLGYGLSSIPMDIPFLPASQVSLGLPNVLWSLVLALFVGLFGGGLPALRAARLKVSEALR